MEMAKYDFILASSSPRRIEMLTKQGYSFKKVVSGADESSSSKDPKKNALEVCLRKAKLVAVKNPNTLILAADTIVVLEKEVLGKPKNKKDALNMLMKLNDNIHTVITAFVIGSFRQGTFKKYCHKAVSSKVRFGSFPKEEYVRYIETKEPMDKAGAYGVQNIGSRFIEHIEGSYTNVVGLPLYEVTKALKKLGIKSSWE